MGFHASTTSEKPPHTRASCPSSHCSKTSAASTSRESTGSLSAAKADRRTTDAQGWVESIKNQCADAGVAFFFKQWGGVQKGKHGRTLDGAHLRQYANESRAPIPPRAERIAITAALEPITAAGPTHRWSAYAATASQHRLTNFFSRREPGSPTLENLVDAFLAIIVGTPPAKGLSMADVTFFETPTIASTKKHRIVSKYVSGWETLVLPKAKAREGKIIYVDLFSGPGQYEDGTPSIPLLVLQHLTNTPALRDYFQTVFNDKNTDYIETLEPRIAQLPGIDRLRHQPKLRNRTIGRDIIPHIKRVDVPTLFFADPFGYEGVSIDLIDAALSHWGSDFLFFFNYNRINMDLGSNAMNEPIDEFFAPARSTTPGDDRTTGTRTA